MTAHEKRLLFPALAVVLLAGCGRGSILAGDGGAGEILEEPACEPLHETSVVLSAGGAEAARPDLDCTEGGFIVAWEERGAGVSVIASIFVDGESGSAGERHDVSGELEGDGAFPSVAAGGGGAGIFWCQDFDGGGECDELYFRALSPDGAPASEPLRLTDAGGLSDQPRACGRAGGFVLAWRDGRDGNPEIYLGRLDGQGRRLIEDRRLTSNDFHSKFPAVSCGGPAVSAAWVEEEAPGSSYVQCALIDPEDGSFLGEPAALSPETPGCSDPALAWTGSGTAAAWQDARDGYKRVFFTHFDDPGLLPVESTPVSEPPGAAGQPSVAWTGSRIGVLWSEGMEGDIDLKLAILDESGARSGPVHALTGTTAKSSFPRIRWNGERFAAVWVENDGESSEVRFSLLRPCHYE